MSNFKNRLSSFHKNISMFYFWTKSYLILQECLKIMVISNSFHIFFIRSHPVWILLVTWSRLPLLPGTVLTLTRLRLDWALDPDRGNGCGLEREDRGWHKPVHWVYTVQCTDVHWPGGQRAERSSVTSLGVSGDTETTPGIIERFCITRYYHHCTILWMFQFPWYLLLRRLQHSIVHHQEREQTPLWPRPGAEISLWHWY